jgi:phosphate-selective porin OprO/OprP
MLLLIKPLQKPLWYLMLCIVCLDSAATETGGSKVPNLFSVSGYLMVDYDRYGAFYNKDDNSSQSHLELRRSKLSLTVKPNKNLKAVLQVKYSNEYQQGETLELGDVYLNYYPMKWLDLRMGRFKQPFNLEQLTSSKNLATIERSLMTDAFSPGSNYGVMLYKNKKSYTWAWGAFQQESNTSSDVDSPVRSMTGRVTYLLPSVQAIWHFGGSLSYRDLAGDLFKFSERGQVNSAQKVIRSASFNANNSTLMQLEGAYAKNSLRISTHAAVTRVEQEDGTLWHYSGFDMQANYLLSGEHYAYKKGKFKSVKSRADNGSWELVTRFSHIDLQDNDLGSEASILLLGVNYYLGGSVKLMADVLIPNISGNVVNTDQSGHALSFRGQYYF